MERALSAEQVEAIDRLKKMREDLGYSQEQFAEILEISDTTYKKIERYNRRISLNNFEMLRKKLSFSMDYIMSGGDESRLQAWYGEIRFAETDSRVCFLRLLRYVAVNCPEVWPMDEGDVERLDEVIRRLAEEQSPEERREV